MKNSKEELFPKLLDLSIKKNEGLVLLGKGAFSSVYLTHCEKDQKNYAVKVVS
jgi:hypothetical protein